MLLLSIYYLTLKSRTIILIVLMIIFKTIIHFYYFHALPFKEIIYIKKREQKEHLKVI